MPGLEEQGIVYRPGGGRKRFADEAELDAWMLGRARKAAPVPVTARVCLDGGVCADEQCAECAEARRLAMQDMEQREAKRRTSPNNRERTGGDQ